MRLLGLVVLLALATPALAQESPEAAYEAFHRAARIPDRAAMAKVSTEKRGREILAGREIELRLLAFGTPETYQITRRQVSRDGTRVQLRASAMHNMSSPPDPKPMYGIIDLVKVDGAWKVDAVGWTHTEWPEEKLD